MLICASAKLRLQIVPSETQAGVRYEVRAGLSREVGPSCNCPAFIYGKGVRLGADGVSRCKHIETLERRMCDYNSELDGLPQTEGICPKCGGDLAFL